MAYLASWIEQANTKTVIEELKKIVTNSGIGFAFEWEVIHSFLPNLNNNQQLHKMKKLTKSKCCEVKDLADNFFYFKRKVFIDTEIAQLEENDLGVPTKMNFPLVDFILKPRVYLQATISKKHKGAINRLNDLNQKMMRVNGNQIKKTPKMFFVLSEKNYDSFRYIPELESIQQYKIQANFSLKAQKRVNSEISDTTTSNYPKKTKKTKKC